MNPPIPVLFLVTGLALAPLHAQAGDEAAFLTQQGDVLHKFALAAFKTGYPTLAKPIWLEVLAEYDKNHAGARKGLGYVKFNTTWSLEKDYPQGDNPKASAARSVQSKWKSVAKAVGNAHKKIAKEFEAAGRADRAKYHIARALRFLPDDEEVRAAMGHKMFGGLSGTDIEETVFQRSKSMDAAVARELEKKYETRELTEAQPQFLTAAGIKCIGFASENFKVWGEWPEADLRSGAENAERSFAFSREFLVGSPRSGEEQVRARTFLFLRGRDHFKLVITTTPSIIPNESQREFIRKNSVCTNVDTGGGHYIMVGAKNAPLIDDACIRFVARQFSGLRTDAMTEGIGHAITGRFLGRNLFFNVAQNKGRTVTKRDRRFTLPDMETWAELAIESAFNPKSTKAARLPLLSAANFPLDGRIKAWSFCDYLLRRDPKLLVDLDTCNNEKNPGGVEKAFAERAGIPLPTLEREWKDFWTGATPVLKALLNRAPVLHMVSKGGSKWIDAFNKARAQSNNRRTVKWSAAYSRHCRQHAEYLTANRGERNGLEHFQRDDLPNATQAGNVFAAMALVGTKSSPASSMKDWIHIPGYRDALINPYLKSVGVYTLGSIAVLDVIRGMEFPPNNVRTGYYPPSNSSDRPKSIAVKLLGPDVARELADRGIKARTIGYPISVHNWRSGSMPGSVEANIFQGGEMVEGFVIAGRGTRHAVAPGMAVFYPIAPLKSGVSVSVEFKRPNGKQIGSWRFKPK